MKSELCVPPNKRIRCSVTERLLFKMEKLVAGKYMYMYRESESCLKAAEAVKEVVTKQRV